MSESSGKGKTIAFHVLAGLLAFAFVGAASGKLMGAPEMVENFARWGYPSWFLYVTGAIEVVAAILIAVPKTRFFGASLLVATMIGGVGTHVIHGEYGAAIPALVLMSLSALVAWSRRATLQNLLGKGSAVTPQQS